MKILFLTSVFTLAAVVASAADSPTLTGTWKIHSSIAGNESDSECMLTQSDKELTEVV